MLMMITSAALADTAQFTNLNFTGQGVSGSGGPITATVGAITMSDQVAFGSTSEIRLYANGAMKFEVSSGYKITNIDITTLTNYTGYEGSGTPIVYGTVTCDVGTVTGSLASKKITWSGETTTSVTLDNTKQVRTSSIVVTYVSTGTGSLTPTTTSFGTGAQSSYDVFMGDTFTGLTATVDNGGTVTYESTNPAVATVNANSGAVTLVAPGSTSIRANYAGDATYAASSASYVLNVGGVYNNIQELQAGATTTLTKAKITFTNVSVTGIKNGSNFYISDGVYGATVNSTSTVTKGQVLNGTFTADVQLSYGATTIKNFLKSSVTVTDGTLTPVTTTIPEIQIANQGRYVTLNNVTFNATAKTFTDASNRTIANYAGLQTNPTLVDGVTYNITGVANAYNTSVEIMPEIAEALPTSASISAAGYATFVAPFDINATAADVTVYTINTVSSASATLTPVTLIPKGTVVLLKGSAGTHSLSSDATQTYTALTGNLLKAAPAGGLTILDTDNIYLLGMPSGQPVGFYRSTAGTLAAGKGYLDGGSIAAGKFLSFTDETTGIDKVNTTTIENNAIYNLNGQKISAPVKGINVINGKKVVIK